jgi:hypothetical protein
MVNDEEIKTMGKRHWGYFRGELKRFDLHFFDAKK